MQSLKNQVDIKKQEIKATPEMFEYRVIVL